MWSVETPRVNNNIVGLTRTSNDAGVAASKLLQAVNALSSQSEQPELQVDGFFESVRAA
jgi:methyl-accepting chemotaxis protein